MRHAVAVLLCVFGLLCVLAAEHVPRSEVFNQELMVSPLPGRIRFQTNYTNCILDAFTARGWQQGEYYHAADFDILWVKKYWFNNHFSSIKFLPHQKINHFANHIEITRKDHLAKNIKRFIAEQRSGTAKRASRGPKRLDFFPMTYILPAEYDAFVDDFRQSRRTKPVATSSTSNTVWIIKPVSKSQGAGISLVHSLKQVERFKNMSRTTELHKREQKVIQKYIAQPYLVDGRKFDLRLYVLVTAFEPSLKLYIYRSGIARFSSAMYTPPEVTVTPGADDEVVVAAMDPFVHLTNNAIQKNSIFYSPENDYKMSLQRLRKHIAKHHGKEAADKAFLDVQEVVIQTYRAVAPIMRHSNNSFEIYGMDVLFDANLVPYLIEVNGAPSFTASSKRDHELKTGLLGELLDILDIEQRDDSSYVSKGFDLVYADNQPQIDGMSWIGCKHNTKRRCRAVCNK